MNAGLWAYFIIIRRTDSPDNTVKNIVRDNNVFVINKYNLSKDCHSSDEGNCKNQELV